MTTATATAGPSSIPLYLINGVATIWDAQTAATLHCEHEISGLRVGTLPGVTQQNGFLGLPMTLMQEETAYLVRKGIAHLVPLKSTPTLPSPEQIDQQRQLRIERIKNLERIAKEEADRNAQAAREMFVKGGDKAKAKREARAKAKAGGAGGEGNLFTPEPEDKQAEGGGETSTTTPKANINLVSPATKSQTKPTAKSAQPSPGYFHTIPSHPPSLPLISNPPLHSIPSPLFQFPSTPLHRANLLTFQTLSHLSYRMGLGPRFGGEYLIYPGDYLRYHAHFTSQVVKGDECIKPMEIVAWGRLGTGTKKAGLICCVPDPGSGFEAEAGGEGEGGKVKEDGVEFYSLEWANFG